MVGIRCVHYNDYIEQKDCMYTAGLDAGGYMIDSLLKNLSARHQRSHKGRTVQGMAPLVYLLNDCGAQHERIVRPSMRVLRGPA